jgi:transaldolase
MIRPASKLHDLGQSLWLDNVTRELLNSGTLQRYIEKSSRCWNVAGESELTKA